MNEYNFGLTNLVARETRGVSDLSKAEMNNAVPGLIEKLRNLRPLILCFVGICVFDSFLAVDRKSNNPKLIVKSKERVGYVAEWEEIKIFVVPSTSGRTSAYQRNDKVLIFGNLKKFLTTCKGENAKSEERLLLGNHENIPN